VNLHHHSQPGTESVPVPLVTEPSAGCIFIPARKTRPKRMSAKADAFAHALNIAVERWGLLPGLDMDPPPSQRESASSQAANA